MKNTKKCPKCSGENIVRVDGRCGPYGSGNNIMLGATIFSGVNVNTYICTDCGYKTGDTVSSNNPQTSTENVMAYAAVLMLAGLALFATAKKCR